MQLIIFLSTRACDIRCFYTAKGDVSRHEFNLLQQTEQPWLNRPNLTIVSIVSVCVCVCVCVFFADE